MYGVNEFNALGASAKVNVYTKWICETNDVMMRRKRVKNARRVRWWMDELTRMCRSVRKERNRGRGREGV